MSLQLKVIAVFIIVIVLVLVQVSGCAAPAGSAADKKIKKPEQIPLTPYQLRYATIGIPSGVTAEPEFSYKINDEDKYISINASIELCDGIDIQAYFDEEITELRADNKIVNITKQKRETIDGNKAFVLHIDHKKHPELQDMFTEYVGILCKTSCVVFKAWGFLKLFTPGEHLWQAMYRSFRSDNSQPYKLPFGSFILPKEARDRSRILLYFLTEEENEEYEEYAEYEEEEDDDEDDDDYYFIIEYASDIKEEKKEILNFKRIILMTFLGALTVIRQNKTVKVGGKKGRYFEALVITPEGSAVTAFLLVPDGLKSGLKITIGSNNPKTFKRYRPQMQTILRSIMFDETAAGGEE